MLGLLKEKKGDLFIGDGLYSLWNRDVPDPLDAGELPSTNMYSSHPFYMNR